MLNSVGLQNPGVSAWMKTELPDLVSSGAQVVASIWGRSVDDYATVAAALQDAPASVVAVEVNLSCPNLDGGRHMFAHSTSATADAIAATTISNDTLADTPPETSPETSPDSSAPVAPAPLQHVEHGHAVSHCAMGAPPWQVRCDEADQASSS